MEEVNSCILHYSSFYSSLGICRRHHLSSREKSLHQKSHWRQSFLAFSHGQGYSKRFPLTSFWDPVPGQEGHNRSFQDPGSAFRVPSQPCQDLNKNQGG
ncbi:uncharacterized protein ACIBXB_020313 isoform 2-T2 [Morphnus guianensis]